MNDEEEYDEECLSSRRKLVYYLFLDALDRLEHSDIDHMLLILKEFS
jgi:hypothetical protein